MKNCSDPLNWQRENDTRHVRIFQVSEITTTVEDQANSFRHVREARRTELVEDYTELIADLIDATGEARPDGYRHRLGVAKPTVNKMLKRLAEEGL